MSALVLDAGAFIAIDGNDRSMIARLRVAHVRGYELRTSAIVIAQVWRSPGGKQANVARILRAVDVRSVDEQTGRDAGVLLAKARADDPIDATVVLVGDGPRGERPSSRGVNSRPTFHPPRNTTIYRSSS